MTTLLIVDDIAQNRYLLETLFQSQGYRTLSAENGAIALDLAQSESLDLVVADIFMPVMDGFELCRRMKQDEHLKTIPFLIYTATYTEPKDERFALSLGADRFILKPQEPEQLLCVIREVLEEGQVHRHEALDASLASEMDYLRQHNGALFHKLDKKMRDLQELSGLHGLLHRINHAIRSAKTEAELFGEACCLCVNGGNFDLAWIGRVPPAGRPLQADFAAGPLTGYTQGLEILLDPALPQARGQSATCLREDRVVVCQDWASDPAMAIWRSRAEPYGIRSSAALPVSHEGLAVAVLNLYSVQSGFFTPDRLNLIEELAKDLSYAITSLTQARQREEAERGLAARETEYRVAFEQGVVGLAQVSLEGRFLKVNRRFCEILGYESEALIGRHFQEFSHPGDRDRSLENILAVMAGPEETYHFQEHFLRKDGRLVLVDQSGGPVRDPDGRVLYLLSAFEDITQRKADEMRILEEKTKLQALIRNIPDLVWYKDLSGAFQYCNPRFEAYWGVREAEILGKTDYDFLEREVADCFNESDRQVLESGAQARHEEWVTFASDGHRELQETIKTPMKDATGRAIGVLGIARDVTQNRLDQERLRKLSKAIEHSPVVVMITDRTGTIEQVNPRFTELTGFTPEEAVGANPRILKSGNTPSEVYTDLWNSILAGRVWHGELQNRKKGGELFWVATSISPIFDETGAVTHFVALNENITNLKHVQTELQEQLLELHRWHEATLGREMRVLDLKREVNELQIRLGQTPRYNSVCEDEPGMSP